MIDALIEVEQATTVAELTKLLKRFRSLKYEKKFITALMLKKSTIERAGVVPDAQVKIDFDAPDNLGVDAHGKRIVKMVNDSHYPIGLRDEDMEVTPNPVFEARKAEIKDNRRDYMLSMFGPNTREPYDNSTEG